VTLRRQNERVIKRRLLVVLVSASTVAVGVGANASAAPIANGCPEGFESMSVVEAESLGYSPVPRLADEGGNRDGLVCRRALGDGVLHTYPGRPDIIYAWVDNDFGK
jgi:hypothetical protein